MTVTENVANKKEIKETIKNPRNLIIGVWATMGTGKSTLIEGIQNLWPGLVVIDEDYEGNPYLDLAYKDPRRYSFSSQVWSRIRKAERYLEINPEKVSLIIPGGVDKGYARTYRERGDISDNDWQTYLRLDRVLETYLPRPDINIWLTIGEKERLNRIIKRDRGAEKKVDPRFLIDLARIMREECLSSGAPVIEVDAEHQDFRNRDKIEEITEGLEYQIYQLLKPKFKDPSSGLLLPQFMKEKGVWV